jgi:DHA2 family multidrug resistance protein-like MFS transporter
VKRCPKTSNISPEGGVTPVSRRRRAYAALILGTILSVLDASIANIALPTIGRELHASPAATVWVTNGFQLAVTASLFTLGSLGQSRGPTVIWRWGIVAFTLGSLLCALSRSFEFLVLARVFQGVGAAAIMSLAPALVRDVYPRSRLGHAFGLNAMYTGVANAAGPTAGGLMLAFLPWQWLFAINVPIAVVIVFLARGAVPDVDGTHKPLDVPSIVTSAVGFSALVYGLDGFARGDSELLVVLELLFGGTVFGWFVHRQLVLPHPLIALDLFRLPRFSVAGQASFAGWAAWSIGVITLPFFLQLDYGMSPLQSGLLMTSWPLATAIVAPIAGRFADHYAVGMVATIGLIIFAFALLMYAYAALHPGIALLLGAGIVGGAGFGIFQTPNNREIMGSGPPEKGGSVAAIFAALRVGGQTFGATLTAIAFASFAPALGAHVSVASLHAAVLAALGIGVVLSLVATFVSGQRALRDGFAYHAP